MRNPRNGNDSSPRVIQEYDSSPRVNIQEYEEKFRMMQRQLQQLQEENAGLKQHREISTFFRRAY